MSHIVFLIEVDYEAKALFQSIFPVVAVVLELIDVGLEADLSSDDLLSEDVADWNLKIT